MGHDFLDHACRTIGCIGVPTSDISRQVSLDFIAEGKLDVVTWVTGLFRIVSFGGPLLVTFHIDHTAVHINGDGFELAPSQQLSEDFEMDFSQHLGGLVAEVSQESGYRFRLFDRNTKLADQRVALQQFQPFQFVNAHQVAAEHALDVVHFDLVGGGVLKN
jgi:hypothetical protein